MKNRINFALAFKNNVTNIAQNYMSRHPRNSSQTGIYHVMLKGINCQQIFEKKEDYRKFICILRDMATPKGETKHSSLKPCSIYAYCLMPDCVHLLIKEEADCISKVVGKVASLYAVYYNCKYNHSGQLFQDRFKSEPVNDDAHFLTLLSYIHQLPVTGKQCRHVEDYDWSSWREYINAPNRMSDFCAVSKVFDRISRQDLIEQVTTPLPKALLVHRFDRYRGYVPDASVIEFLTSTYHIESPKDILQYPKKQRYKVLKDAKDFGASIRQLSRLTALSEYTIAHAGAKKIYD